MHGHPVSDGSPGGRVQPGQQDGPHRRRRLDGMDRHARSADQYVGDQPGPRSDLDDPHARRGGGPGQRQRVPVVRPGVQQIVELGRHGVRLPVRPAVRAGLRQFRVRRPSRVHPSVHRAIIAVRAPSHDPGFGHHGEGGARRAPASPRGRVRGVERLAGRGVRCQRRAGSPDRTALITRSTVSCCSPTGAA